MTAEGQIQVGVSTKLLDTAVVNQTDGTEVHREAVVITDPETNAARATVPAFSAGYGLYTTPGTIKSANNTSTTALGASETYTGAWEAAPADGVTVSCLADQDGTLFFDFSNDGGTTSTTFPSSGFVLSANIHEFHRAAVAGRSFRVRVVNGASAQSSLALYTYFGPHTHPAAPLSQSLGTDADAMIVRTVDPSIDLALGRLGGAQQRSKFGYTTGLGTGVQLGTPSTWEHLWAYGGIRTSPTTSFTPFMASDSTSDTDVDVTWQYLDADGIEQTVTVNTNGQAPVSLGVTATEVYRGFVSGGTACVGNIACLVENDFTNGVPDQQNDVLVYIVPNDQQSQVLAFRVPSDKKAILQVWDLTVARASGAGGAVDLALQIRNDGGVFRTIRPIQATTNSPVMENMEGVVLDPLTDVRVQIRDVSDNATQIAGNLRYIFVDA